MLVFSCFLRMFRRVHAPPGEAIPVSESIHSIGPCTSSEMDHGEKLIEYRFVLHACVIGQYIYKSMHLSYLEPRAILSVNCNFKKWLDEQMHNFRDRKKEELPCDLAFDAFFP